MVNHLARRRGIWWVRLVVPARLREAAGRREFTKSTRTHELHVAKLVAAATIADWRKLLMRLEAHAHAFRRAEVLGARHGWHHHYSTGSTVRR